MTTRTGIIIAIGDWSARHKRMAIFGWLILVAAAAVFGALRPVYSTPVQHGVPAQHAVIQSGPPGGQP